MLNNDRINILFLVILALVVGGFCLAFLPSFSETAGDSEDYDTAAWNLAQGKGFTFNNEPAKIAPGYSLFLSGIYYVFGHNYLAVKIIQFLLLAAIAVIAYLLARIFLNFSGCLALFSSLTIVVWPYFVFYPNLIVTEILFTFLLLLSTYFLLAFQRNPSLKNSLILGVLLGAAALVRVAILFLPVWLAFFFLVFLKPAREKSYLLKLALFLAVFLTIFSPWIIRNYLHFDQPIPVYSHVVEKSYVGLPEQQTGEASFKTAALTRLKNVYLFWNPGAGGTNAETLEEAFPIMGILFLIYKALFFIVLVLTFWSLKWIKKNQNVFLLWLIIFYTWTLHTVLWPYPRYTLPIIPLVIILAWFSLRKIAYRNGEKT